MRLFSYMDNSINTIIQNANFVQIGAVKLPERTGVCC